MKKFFKSLVLVAASVFSITAAQAVSLNVDSVNSAGFGNLTEAQKADVISQIAKQAEQNSKNGNIVSNLPSASTLSEWASSGAEIGKGLAAAAKELGIAVNDFVKTPVGQITMILIIWKVIGAELVHIFGGLLILLFGHFVMRFILRWWLPLNITYDSEKKNIFGNYVIKSRSYQKATDDQIAGILLSYALIITVAVILVFSF